MNRVFITGSEGFFGSTLIELLIKKNYKVVALVQYNSFQSIGWLGFLKDDIKKKIKIIHGDIRDKEFLENNINSGDIIVNLAALISIPYSFEAPRSFFDNNLLGTLNLLEVAKKKKIKKFIQTSTSEVYGSAQFVPMTEKHPINPQSPYAASKSACDQLAMSYFYTYNLPITILRPFNMFGPRQSLRAVIPTIITQSIKNKKNFIRLGNLSSSRDFTYSEDIAIAFEKSFKLNKINGKVINLGSGFEIFIKDIVFEVNKILGKDIKIIVEKKRLRPFNSEVSRLYASNKLAKKYLNWNIKIKNNLYFREKLRRTILWYEKNLNMFENFTKYNF